MRLPEHIAREDAALIEPLSCAVRGYDVLQAATLGAHVLIYGSGTMGLMMLELAKRTGAASVDVVDVNPDRLATARRLGCSALGRHRRRAGPAAGLGPRRRRHRQRGGDPGRPGPGRQGRHLPAVRRRRLRDDRATIEPYRIYNQEITITGSMAVLHSYERAAELFASGVLDPDVFISDRLPLEQYPEALDRFKAGKGRKIVVEP